MWQRLVTAFRHRWVDETDTRRAIDDALLERLARRVAASEARHSGEIRISVEAGLPVSYLWRHLWHKTPIGELMRQRAVAQFACLRVWDTEHNNGVLIYLLLAEHEIELVADRGLNRFVSQEQWQGMVQRMGRAFAAGRFEEGLTQALEEVSAPLVEHFALQPGQVDSNELPDLPERR